jgi:hypothetical protein
MFTLSLTHDLKVGQGQSFQLEQIEKIRMPSKSEVCSELEKLGVAFLPKMSLAELTTLLKRARGNSSTKVEEKKFRLKKNPMTGVSKMRKQFQQVLLMMLEGVPMKKMTKGDLELEIREKLDAGLQRTMPHGKYKGNSIETIIEAQDEGYYEWVLETINNNSHESFILLKAVIILMFQGQLDSFCESMESGEEDEPVLLKAKEGFGKTVPKDDWKEHGSPGRKWNNEPEEKTPKKATSSKDAPKMTAAKSMARPKRYKIHTPHEEEEEEFSDSMPSVPPQSQDESSNVEWMEIGQKRRK